MLPIVVIISASVARPLCPDGVEIDGLFDFVAQHRKLSTFYIKQMHQVFMRNQSTTKGLDEFGHLIEIEVLHGDWKKWPNSPSRPDGQIHQYCPPEQVASEMDRLIALHERHLQDDISPEAEAAWLHHRFTQIHPFQDGNGRVARALATLVLLRAGRFPLVIADEQRSSYIEACEQADLGELKSLIALFTRQQIQAFRQALGISEDVVIQNSIQAVIQQSLERLRQRRIPSSAFDISRQLETFSRQRLQEIAQDLSGALQQIEPGYRASVLCSDSETDFWFKGQIIQIAKKFEYYANSRNYRAWVQLKIKEQRLTNLLLSFHGLGYEFSGIMAVSAFLEFRSGTESDEVMPVGPYPANTDIFQFSYRDEPAQVIERFKPWLEDTILIGLEQWRKQL
jgi:fido (protein-threonine AMPylation protein)